MKRPVYRLAIDEMTEGMDFMALVDAPAHGKTWTTMAKQKAPSAKYAFNSEKQIVTGVAIATNQLIYRRDPDGFEYDVYLTKADTFEIMKRFAKNGYHNNVNLMHEADLKVDDAALIECYFVREDRQNIPEAFADQNLQPGSLIFSYWIESPKTWEFVKKHGTGFSLEGWFNSIPVKFLKEKQKQNKMEKKSLFERLGFAKKEEPKREEYNSKHEYATAVNTDGDTVEWDGDLVEGVSIFIIPEEGEPVLAPEGEMTLDVDGQMLLVVVNENGQVASVEQVEAMENDDEEEEEEMSEVEEALRAIRDEYKEKFNTQENQIQEMAKAFDELNEAFEALRNEKSAKSTRSKTSGGYASLKGK